MSAKNQLQELFQAKGLPIPIYETSIQETSPPSWVATVQPYQGPSFTGVRSNSKTEATSSAAQVALDWYSKVPNFPAPVEQKVLKREKPKFKREGDGVLLVDIENFPRFLELATIPEGLDVYGFIGEHNPRSQYILPPGVVKVISPGMGKDSADVLMSVFVGGLLIQGMYDYYLIATGDHFGQELVQSIESDGFGWKGRPSQLITNPKEL